MYNESQKIKFLEDSTDSVALKKLSMVYFNKLSDSENGWGHDIAIASQDMVIEAVFKILSNSMSSSSARTIFNLIRRYARWCSSEGLPVNKELEHIKGNAIITSDGLDCKMVSSPSQLKEILDNPEVIQPTSAITVDLVVKGALWLAFSGIDITDAIKLAPENIIFKLGIIYTPKGVYPIYPESTKELYTLCTTENFNYHHQFYSKIRDRKKGVEVLRGFNALSQSYIQQSIYFTFNEDCPYNLTYNSVYMSGVFYRIYQQEIKGGAFNPTEILNKDIYKKETVLSEGLKSKTRPTRNYIINKYNDYLRDYNRWKEAFGL